MRLCTFPSALQLLTVFDETCLVSGDSEIGDRLLTEIVGASKSKQKLFFFFGNTSTTMETQRQYSTG